MRKAGKGHSHGITLWKTKALKLRGLGQSPSDYFLLFTIAFVQLVQAMALAHGDGAANGDGVGVMDNLVHDGVVNGAVLVGVGINAFIPSVSYWVQKTVALCLVWASMISSRTKAY